VIGGEVVTR